MKANVASTVRDLQRLVQQAGPYVLIELVLPGGIDSHVHFSQDSGPGIVMADDFGWQPLASALPVRHGEWAQLVHDQSVQ